MNYDGIELIMPDKPARLTHSVYTDMISHTSGTQNMDYVSKLSQVPWGAIRLYCPESFHRACQLFSLMNMDYQVCNGGYEQYYSNGYHVTREPFHADDITHLEKAEQGRAFRQLTSFSKAVFPDRQAENKSLERACRLFQSMHLCENVPVTTTIHPEEEDGFVPYEETSLEDIVEYGDEFESAFYKANDYMEEVMEIQAQYLYRALQRDMDAQSMTFPILNILYAEIFDADFPSLNKRLEEIHSQENHLTEEYKSLSLEAGKEFNL